MDDDNFSLKIDLTGVIDIHVHSGPDVSPRKMDDLDLARLASARGMRAILIKSHYTLTADRASLVEKVVPQIRVFGGLALNRQVGGLNPYAVEAALKMGAAEIWMPTFSSVAETNDQIRPGISIYDGDRLRPELLEILSLIAEHDAILGTGHLTAGEISTLVPAAHRLGVHKILITHPEHPPVKLPIALQQELRDRYGVFFERCLITTTFGGGEMPFETLAEAIRRVGPDSTIIATDFGQVQNAPPPEGMACFITQLRAFGFNEMSIIQMSQDNPARLLGITP